MEENPEKAFSNDLQECFNDLKKHSISFKLGQSHQTAGDEAHNPLHKQFEIILTKIEEILAKHNKDSEEYLKIISMKASIVYEKAKIMLSENLLSDSQILLEEALALIKDYSEHPKVAFLHMRIVNHLTYVLSRLGQLEEAKELLLKAIEDGNKCRPEVFSTDDLFLNTKKDAKVSATKFNRLTINNMQMLAWIHARYGNVKEHLKLQHDILQKQLDTDEGDVLKWAESCFRLAGMYVSQGDWPNALYHLIAAEAILNPLEVALIPNQEVHAAQADLARSWVYYGLQLFETSRKSKIPKDIESDDGIATTNDDSNQEISKPAYKFEGLQVEMPKDAPTSRIENLEQAKALFAQIQKWIKRARLFYTLRDYPLQYVNLCLDLSELFRFVAFYEEDIEAQYAVQKRRYDALETLSNILREVRPNCYMAVNVELIKELIEVQIELMNLNLKKLYVPTQAPRVDVNENVLRRQMHAFHNLNTKLESVTSCLNTTAYSSVSMEKSEISEINEVKSETIEEKSEVTEKAEIKPIDTPNE